jgi:hypothetical protein
MFWISEKWSLLSGKQVSNKKVMRIRNIENGMAVM